MAFVNELETQEELNKYFTPEQIQQHHISIGNGWTIDRERKVILILETMGNRWGTSNICRFLLSRPEGIAHISLIPSTNDDAKTIEWEEERFREPNYKSEESRLFFEAQLRDLKDALLVHKVNANLPSKYNAYDVVFKNF